MNGVNPGRGMAESPPGDLADRLDARQALVSLQPGAFLAKCPVQLCNALVQAADLLTGKIAPSAR